MEAKAVAKYVRMSPIKLKPVTDLVRGKNLSEALTILKFTPGKGAEIVEKVVKSAAATLRTTLTYVDKLYVAEVIQPGPYHEEMESRAQGRATVILKEAARRRNFKRKIIFITGGALMGQK
jgi:large subunit ribosomal protein L22